MELSKSLQSIIFNLNEENIESSVQSTIELFTYNRQYTFNLLISGFIYTAFASQLNVKFPIFKYLLMLNLEEEKTNKNTTNLVHIFNLYLLQTTTQESFFLLRKMDEQGLFETDPAKYNKKNCELVLNNDFANLKNFNEEGHNPNEIAKIIRNDEIEKLQEISSQPNFDFNQIIEPSIYERCSFINQENVKLIDYAAFFSSVKCFKYLLMNGSKIDNAGKYAVAGGSLEIIHLCEQNHSSFEDAYETAIEFHKNDIFKYLYEKKKGEVITKSNKQSPNINHGKSEKDIAYFKKICLNYNNYIIFSFLEQETKEITEDIIEEIARNGNTFLMDSIIENQQIPNTILLRSVESGNIEIVKLLLDKGIDINAKTRGETALHIAVKNNNIKIVKLLLEKEGIDVNAKYVREWRLETALHIAVRNNNIEIVKLLLEKEGIDVNAKTRDVRDERDVRLETALHIAVRNNNIEIVKLLLEKEGIDVNAKTEEREWRLETALHIAVRNNNIEIVKLLLEKEGIDVNAKTRDEELRDVRLETALHIAVRNNNIEIVKLLLEKEGIDVNAKTRDVRDRGETALHIAVKNNNIEIVKLLFDKEINIKTSYLLK